MKNNSKYIAGLIIVFGTVLIYFIPDISKAIHNYKCDYCSYKTDEALIEMKENFNKDLNDTVTNGTVILIDDIYGVKTPDNKGFDMQLYGTVTHVFNSNNYPVKYRAGEKYLISSSAKSSVSIPDKAVLFMPSEAKDIGQSSRWYYYNNNTNNLWSFDEVRKKCQRYRAWLLLKSAFSEIKAMLK